MTINELISALSALPPTKPVRFDFCGLRPTHIRSWRGDYSQPALGYTNEPPTPTVESLLKELRKSLTVSHTGYKGGDYFFSGDEPIHIDNYGCCNQTVLSHVEISHSVILRTTHDNSL